MILSIGEILFDIFPEYKRIGGAPFNFAFHLKNLGIPARFISRIGDDADGKEILQQLKHRGFFTDNIQIDHRHPTGRVMVKLDARGVPEFNILQNMAYDHIAFDPSIASMLDENPDLIYFGSLIQRSPRGFQTLHNILTRRNRQHTKCLYDINLRPQCFSKTIITESLKQTDVLKLNDEELEIIKQMFGFEKKSSAIIEFLITEFDIEMISLTKGQKGSCLYTKNEAFCTAPISTGKIVDTVGAGDAYTAILATGYLNTWHPERILKVATEFASRICEIEGAVPPPGKFYETNKRLIKEITGE
jgi:fructokinase